MAIRSSFESFIAKARKASREFPGKGSEPGAFFTLLSGDEETEVALTELGKSPGKYRLYIPAGDDADEGLTVVHGDSRFFVIEAEKHGDPGALDRRAEDIHWRQWAALNEQALHNAKAYADDNKRLVAERIELQEEVYRLRAEIKELQESGSDNSEILSDLLDMGQMLLGAKESAAGNVVAVIKDKLPKVFMRLSDAGRAELFEALNAEGIAAPLLSGGSNG